MSQVSHTALLAIQARVDDGRAPAAGAGGTKDGTTSQGDFARLMAGRLTDRSQAAPAAPGDPAAGVRGGDGTAASAIQQQVSQDLARTANSLKDAAQAAGRASGTPGDDGASLPQAAARLDSLIAQLRRQLGHMQASPSAAADKPAAQQRDAALAGVTGAERLAAIDQMLGTLRQSLGKSLKQTDLPTDVRAALERIRTELDKQMQGLDASGGQGLAALGAHIDVLSHGLRQMSSLLAQSPALQTSGVGRQLARQLQGHLAQLAQMRQSLSTASSRPEGAGTGAASGATAGLSGMAASLANADAAGQGGPGGGQAEGGKNMAGQLLSGMPGGNGAQAGMTPAQAAASALFGGQAGESRTAQAEKAFAALTGMTARQVRSEPGRQAQGALSSTPGDSDSFATLAPTYTSHGLSAATALGGSGHGQSAHPQLATNLGQQVQWMVGKNISSASISVNPAELGPLKIQIDLHSNDLKVQLLASHHMTRDMLEQSLPRLREWLQEAGMPNAQVSIGAQTSGDGAEGAFAQMAGQGSGGDGSGNGSGSHSSGSAGEPGEGVTTAAAALGTSSGPIGQLDLFA